MIGNSSCKETSHEDPFSAIREPAAPRGVRHDYRATMRGARDRLRPGDAGAVASGRVGTAVVAAGGRRLLLARALRPAPRPLLRQSPVLSQSCPTDCRRLAPL